MSAAAGFQPTGTIPYFTHRNLCKAAGKQCVSSCHSTVGVSARLQKSSPAVLFCNDCLRDLCERLCSTAFCEAVNSAYTTLIQRLRERSKAEDRVSS